MKKFVECCGYMVSEDLSDFLSENDFSMRICCVVCRHFCTVDEAIFYLKAVARDELCLRNLGKRSTAEVKEKMKKYM